MRDSSKSNDVILMMMRMALVFGAAAVSSFPGDGTAESVSDPQEISFRKHTIDEGRAESVAVADVNQDGLLDIISGDNWYEQARATGKDAGLRWLKHHFRDL